ncbi:MAG: hypothetical protein GX154_05795 [Clostridiales bacterium]|nr:hypothetical protein [Clostridiales bacterium]
MLLREFEIDEHILTLDEIEDNFSIVVKNSRGERLFSQEYDSYEEVREIFDLIVKEYEGNYINIERVLDILQCSM